MGTLAQFVPSDRPEVEALLDHPDGLHLYLRSHLDLPDEGEGFVYRAGGRMEGHAWFGKGRNLLLAGDDPTFLSRLATLCREREEGWVMLVGPWGPTSELLSRYTRLTHRRPRLDRAQGFFVQTRETLPDLREPTLAPATESDVEELVGVSTRMSAEDFEIDPWRIDRGAVRRSVGRNVRAGRSFVYREEGVLVFKAEVAVRGPEGSQIEGVFTVESRRGRGIASRCMSELGHRLLAESPRVTLHAAAANEPARRAYENAGYRRAAELRLAIFRPPHPE